MKFKAFQNFFLQGHQLLDHFDRLGQCFTYIFNFSKKLSTNYNKSVFARAMEVFFWSFKFFLLKFFPISFTCKKRSLYKCLKFLK